MISECVNDGRVWRVEGDNLMEVLREVVDVVVRDVGCDVDDGDVVEFGVVNGDRVGDVYVVVVWVGDRE